MASCWTLKLEGWLPHSLNKLMNSHWAVRRGLKQGDKDQIRKACLVYGVPKAEGRRHVSVLIVLPKGRRALDADNVYKGMLDGLVEAEVLRNDSHVWCTWSPVHYARGDRLVTFITLEDEN